MNGSHAMIAPQPSCNDKNSLTGAPIPTPGRVKFRRTRGIVVGSWVVGYPGQKPALRAFIHRQGLTQDLTDLGVKLPAGAYFSAVAGVNAKGSILATQVDAKGLKPVEVRLTLVP